MVALRLWCGRLGEASFSICGRPSIPETSPSLSSRRRKSTFAIVDVSVENKGDKEASISSLMQVSMIDGDGFKYNVNVVVEGTKGSFDGKVAAGRSLRGEVGFEVPQTAKSLEFIFSDPFKKGELIWKAK
ncbi:DUF4352 domain-containing protein [Paenibacillus flagellatus]|uniref:DUF4352 domain-containing protein n=1 Tax=Paenibacillus flagellatus TaxID=2211139 RepID=A0A2V5K612_9BACL|nr:DUF4352 domain-containing protein [Paenibacillus flagellatus]PYI54805.1 hypothetical protein DLM86_09620 [Paenibacillus flagellatus]